MGIISSNAYLAVFSAGTLIGATSTYILLKYLRKLPVNNNIWKPGMEERFEFEDPNDEYRLIMGVRNDLKMQKGKVAAQCGHAAVAAYAKALNHTPKTLKRWLKYGGTKIAVRVDSEQELLDLEKKAKELKVLASVIRDAGQTQVAPGSRTVIAIGPAPKSVLDKITGHLKLY
ncbi:peptidyl-tRNA hydrolase 2, mitochondrial-like [Tribolium madens]|uniref:peptidyl-tRNA hydrolase 2, mitochondrial-like n=1 Tax=Tribolium madens TaxID=41895 RepID=UPI001CF759FE|nr:peptidyl-tRNA hydrolase 2, mitochondrial-like [Tribolium madens]